MQQIHLDRISQKGSEVIRVPGNRIGCRQLTSRLLKGPCYGGVGSRIASEIDSWRIITMNGERRRDTLLGRKQACQVGIQFANLAVIAGNRHAIAPRRTGRATNKMVALIDRKSV